jgi:hypothetical protein
MDRQSSRLFSLRALLRRNYLRGTLALLLLLIVTPSAGAELVNYKLSGSMPAFGDVVFDPSFQISPDGQTVVYVADQEADEVFELFASYDESTIYVPLILR